MNNLINPPMMILLLVIFLIIDGAITMNGAVSRVVNESNFVVSIWYFHEHRCSGAIIDDTHVLTTGHCVHGIPECILSVAAGIVELHNRNLQRIGVKELHFHRDFREIRNPLKPNELRWDNNIAILELAENVIWSLIIGPARLLHEEFEWNMCSVCKLFGWNDGILDDTRLLSLHWAQAAIIANEECGASNIQLSNNEKCAENLYTNSFMEDGDRGSLFICDNSAVGIFVGGGKMEGSPLALLAIHPYLEFIAETVHAGPINVPLRDFQYFISLWYFGTYRCGGTIIDATHIITAAHCVHGIARYGLQVIAGHNELCGTDKTVGWSQVESIQKHPNYARTQYDNGDVGTTNDLAILTLEVPLVWSANIRPVPLADAFLSDEPHEVYRWIHQYTPHKCIKSVHSYGPLMTWRSCSLLGIHLYPHQYCINSLHSLPIAVHGDSGSSIISNGRLVGVLHGGNPNWYVPMGSNNPVIFTSIYPYLDWIGTVVTSSSS